MKKENHYKSGKLKFRRENLHLDALERQKEHSLLSTAEKLRKAQSRPGASKKEISRLVKENRARTEKSS